MWAAVANQFFSREEHCTALIDGGKIIAPALPSLVLFL